LLYKSAQREPRVTAPVNPAQVEEVYGRDIRAEDVEGIVAGLQLWCDLSLFPPGDISSSMG